jgi:hypothetical protein
MKHKMDFSWETPIVVVVRKVTTKHALIRFLISNCACLGHLHRKASPRESEAQRSREIWLLHRRLVSYTRFLRLKATSWPSGLPRGRLTVEMTNMQ